MPRRLLTVTFWRRRGRLLGAVLFCGLLLVVAVATRTLDQRNFDRAVCTKIDGLAGAQLGGLNRGLKMLPTIAYYRHHPDELAHAQVAMVFQIQAIKAASC